VGPAADVVVVAGNRVARLLCHYRRRTDPHRLSSAKGDSSFTPGRHSHTTGGGEDGVVPWLTSRCVFSRHEIACMNGVVICAFFVSIALKFGLQTHALKKSVGDYAEPFHNFS